MRFAWTGPEGRKLSYSWRVVHDESGSAGHAHIPFYVTPPGTLPPVPVAVTP